MPWCCENAGVEIAPDPRPDDTPWPQAQWPPPHELRGQHVGLTQFAPDDATELFAALDHDPCWEHVAGRPRTPEALAVLFAEAPDKGRWPWVVRALRPVGKAPAGAVVGTTSYFEVSLHDARLEIGHTVYSPAVWATSVNPEAKLLLLTWAFDHGFGRVQLKTDIRNHRSQRAIAGLGAAYEGVLRRYQRRADGTVRDSVLFSVTAEDWPAVRTTLEGRLRSS